MKTGNTEHFDAVIEDHLQPQWSPVMKTGNTRENFLDSFTN